jgi:hypothetical protein
MENWLDKYGKGGLIKRADGSYSKRGLWDNIRANKGSGRKPTAEMLEQEKKIKKHADGGWIDMYNEGSWVADSSLPTPTTSSFYPAGEDRTLTNYQMGTDKAPMYGNGTKVYSVATQNTNQLGNKYQNTFQESSTNIDPSGNTSQQFIRQTTNPNQTPYIRYFNDDALGSEMYIAGANGNNMFIKPDPIMDNFLKTRANYMSGAMASEQIKRNGGPIMYREGATVWTDQDSALWVNGGSEVGTQDKRYPSRNTGSLNTSRYLIGDVIPTGMNYKTPAAGTYDYSKDIQPPKKMVLHAPDTTMMAKHGSHVTSAYKKRVGIPYAISPGVSNAGIYVGPTTQRGITFANGGWINKYEDAGFVGGNDEYEKAKAQYIKASNMGPMGENQMQQLVKQFPLLANDSSLAGYRSVGNAAMFRNNEEANRIETNTLGQVISTPASRKKAQREQIVAERPGVYNIEDYKMGIQEPGASNDVMDDPVAMAIFGAATGGIGLGARSTMGLANSFGRNLASEVTFGGYDLTNGIKNLIKNNYLKQNITNIKNKFKDIGETISHPTTAISRLRYPKNTIEGDYVRHFNSNRLPSNLNQIDNITLNYNNMMSDVYENANTGSGVLDNQVKQKLAELQSEEGFKRLYNQEYDMLKAQGFTKADLKGNYPLSYTDEDALAYQASFNANQTIDRLANTGNLNDSMTHILYNHSLNNNNTFDPLYFNNTLENHEYPYFNAFAYSDNYNPRLMLGFGYGQNAATADHEINHILQGNRTTKLDDALRWGLNTKIDWGNKRALHDYDYFLTGSDGKEATAFLAELRQAMKQRGFIKNTYDPITPELMEDAYKDFTKSPAITYQAMKGTPTSDMGTFSNDARIFGFMKPSKSNFELLSNSMNKLPVFGGVGLVGAGALSQTSDENNIQKQANGGWIEQYN